MADNDVRKRKRNIPNAVTLHILVEICFMPERQLPSTPARQQSLDWLKMTELITHRAGSDEDTYDLTQKGRVLIDMLLETPLPVEMYVDPRQ